MKQLFSIYIDRSVTGILTYAENQQNIYDTETMQN